MRWSATNTSIGLQHGAARGAVCVSGRQLLLDERMQDLRPPQVPVPVVSPFGKV
jgi:hypothetical protein